MASNGLQFPFDKDEEKLANTAPHKATQVQEQPEKKEERGDWWKEDTPEEEDQSDDHTDLTVKRVTPYQTLPNNSPAISIPAGRLCW